MGKSFNLFCKLSQELDSQDFHFSINIDKIIIFIQFIDLLNQFMNFVYISTQLQQEIYKLQYLWLGIKVRVRVNQRLINKDG